MNKHGRLSDAAKRFLDETTDEGEEFTMTQFSILDYVRNHDLDPTYNVDNALGFHVTRTGWSLLKREHLDKLVAEIEARGGHHYQLEGLSIGNRIYAFRTMHRMSGQTLELSRLRRDRPQEAEQLTDEEMDS